MKPEPYPKDIFTPLTKEDWKKIDEILRKHGYSLDRVSGNIGRKLWKNFMDRVDWLLKEIQMLDFEMQFGENWRKHEWARTQEFANFVYKIIDLIKKAFGGVRDG